MPTLEPPNDGANSPPRPAQSAENEPNHAHPEGLFCDDCPDALRQNLKRLLVQHKTTNDYFDRDCICGWRMPFVEEQQYAGHLADILATTLADLGWQRPMRSQDGKHVMAGTMQCGCDFGRPCAYHGCSWCHGTETTGHAPDCEYVDPLSRPGQSAPTERPGNGDV